MGYLRIKAYGEWAVCLDCGQLARVEPGELPDEPSPCCQGELCNCISCCHWWHRKNEEGLTSASYSD